MKTINNSEQLHEQIGFWVILASTIFIPLFTALFIRSELNLVFTPDNIDSYKHTMKIFSFPMYLISIGMAVLAFYALWFRTTQTSQQILLSQKQIEHQQETREIESITNEINITSKLILKLVSEVEITPYENIKLTLLSDRSIERWDYNFDHKYVCYKKHPDNLIVPWSTTMVNLKHFHDNSSKKITLDMYQTGEISNAGKHWTIAGNLQNLIFFCKKLAELDNTSYQIVKTKLSPFYDILDLLYKVTLIEGHVYELFHVLQSLASSENGVNIDLLEIFSNELNTTGMTEKTITKEDLSMQPIVKTESKGIQYTVNYKKQSFKRVSGSWSDITPTET